MPSNLTLILCAALAALAAAGPCDIYDKAGTPCVAAHAMTRALYSAYDGPLYTLRRASDNTTKDISVAGGAGGIADSASHDAFCGSDASCTVHRIFDQSPRGNHLDLGPPGGAGRQPDKGVNATKAPIKLAGGEKVYGAFFEGGMGYRNDNTSGIATGDDPESMYMVADGKNFNGGCCFDYGNAETDAIDHGAGTMEAIYFGNSRGWGHGAGAGPWVMADLENGLWAGDQRAATGNTPLTSDFVTAMVKGNSGNHFALKGGDAQAGALKTMWDGGRPKGYEVMKKQGAIILGIGGDNSFWAKGTFFEGVMTQGFSTDATDDAVQKDIVAAGYAR